MSQKIAKRKKEIYAIGIFKNGYQSIGRGEMIRTSDPLHPMQVRYQAALRPDFALVYNN